MSSLVIEEDKNFIEKARSFYKEKYVDTGYSAKTDENLEKTAKNAGNIVKVIGTAATIALVIFPGDGPIGEIATALATPVLAKLVEEGIKIQAKVNLTIKDNIEKKIFKVDKEGTKGYTLKDNELIEDIKNVKKLTEEAGYTYGK